MEVGSLYGHGGPVGVTPFAGGNPSLGAGPGTALPVAYSYVPSVLASAIVDGHASADQSVLTTTAAEATAADALGTAVDGLGASVEGLGSSVEGLGSGIDGLGDAGAPGVAGLTCSGPAALGCPTCIAVLDDGGDGGDGGGGAD